jgi:hypothetical protein
MKYTLNNKNNENTVISENCRKNNQIWTNYDREIHVTKFDCGLKREMSSATRGRINCSSFSKRTKEEAKGIAACRRPHCARFGGFDTQDGIPGLVGGK